MRPRQGPACQAPVAHSHRHLASRQQIDINAKALVVPLSHQARFAPPSNPNTASTGWPRWSGWSTNWDSDGCPRPRTHRVFLFGRACSMMEANVGLYSGGPALVGVVLLGTRTELRWLRRGPISLAACECWGTSLASFENTPSCGTYNIADWAPRPFPRGKKPPTVANQTSPWLAGMAINLGMV